MIIKTVGSIYEVDDSRNAFRRIHRFDGDAQMPIGSWYRYQRMGPVVVGEPLRFFWVNGEEGGLTRIGLWTSSPVAEILADGADDQAQGGSDAGQRSAPQGPPFLIPERRVKDRRRRGMA